MTAIARILTPPADRPPWHRGLRAPLAAVACLGAFWAALNFGTQGLGGSIASWDEKWVSIEYTLDGAGWGAWVFPVACAGLLSAAALLWLARGPAGLALGLALLAGGVGGVVATIVDRNRSGRVIGDEVHSLPMGMDRDRVTDRLGSPAGHGHVELRGERLDCLVYVNTTARWEERSHVGLCFDEGRLVYRRAG